MFSAWGVHQQTPSLGENNGAVGEHFFPSSSLGHEQTQPELHQFADRRLKGFVFVRNQIAHRVAPLEPRPDLIEVAASLGKPFLRPFGARKASIHP